MRVSINGWPISAPFGSLDPSHPVAHKGVDFAVNTGTPIPAISDGVVTALTDEGTVSFGKAVHVQLPNGDEVVYAHLSKVETHVGQTVHQGDIIALSGNTGRSDGPHLHLQVMHNGHAVDPLLYFHMSGDTGSTGFETLDHWSEIWKQNAERIFHIPDVATNHAMPPTQVLQDRVLEAARDFGHTLNENSPDIITFSLCICAGVVMVAPLLGLDSPKWLGRMTGVFFIGIAWRALL